MLISKAKIYEKYAILVGMKSEEVRKRFLEFFRKRGHTILPSASLVPENDPSVLFTTAGMQPLVPFLMGEEHPGGKRLANVQKCVRTGDIDEIGDNTHLTFFEMMGNWSLGDYFKKEAILWSFELLTDKKDGFGLDPRRLYVTCFEGNSDAPKDEESAGIWKDIFERKGIKGERIYFMPAKNNWWQPGPNGPCGPDTEMFYDLTGKLIEGMNKEEFLKADEDQRIVEIWNDVFMEFLKKDDQVVGKLEVKNVDTGSGLERVTAVLQGKRSVFETDLFESIISKIRELSGVSKVPFDTTKAERIIADHIRSAVFMVADGVAPSNTDQGYVLRRLLRRAVRYADILGFERGGLSKIVDPIAEKYGGIYQKIENQKTRIKIEIQNEEEKFKKTLEKGMREFEKIVKNKGGISGEDAFNLYQTYGFPWELTKELAQSKGILLIGIGSGFETEFKKHQELSRSRSEQKFKGGLGGTGEMETKYHTATHILRQALEDVLNEKITQKGSNITAERLRFDFTFSRKMTEEEKKKVEDLVNQKISENLPVKKILMKREEAEKTGAAHVFGEKYGDEVSIYYIGDTLHTAWSKEFCGGPHSRNTGNLGKFKILKEEAVASGVRRIKAILE